MLLRKINSYKSIVQRRSLQTAYNIYPHTNAEEQEKQACYLTKTVLNDSLLSPDRVSHTLSDDKRNQMVDSVWRKIIEINYFHRDEELKWKKMSPQKMINRIKAKFRSDFSYQIVLNMLRVIWSSDAARKCGVSSTNFSYRPDLVAPWERGYQKIQVSGKLGHLIQGRSLLPVFADQQQVEKTRSMEVIWDDIISPFFDLRTVESNFTPNSGFHPDAPYPVPQTLLLFSNFRWPSRMNTGQAIFYSFAHAMTYALTNGEKLGEELKTPVPIQCISFDGTSFFFIRYQLNSLNFDDSKNSLKNMVWITSDVKLYDDVTDKQSDSVDYMEFTGERTSLVDFNRKRLSKNLQDVQEVKVSLEGFNRSAVDLFIDYILYPNCEKMVQIN